MMVSDAVEDWAMSDQDARASLAAEELAARILQFLAEDPGRMARFFNTTGLTAETIRTAARAPGFAMSVLDYVLEDEALLKDFAAGATIRPEEMLRLMTEIVHPIVIIIAGAGSRSEGGEPSSPAEPTGRRNRPYYRLHGLKEHAGLPAASARERTGVPSRRSD